MSDIPGGLAAALSDRYVLERQVGAGGMATVYLARDLRHKRLVALKVVRPELGGRRSSAGPAGTATGSPMRPLLPALGSPIACRHETGGFW